MTKMWTTHKVFKTGAVFFGFRFRGAISHLNIFIMCTVQCMILGNMLLTSIITSWNLNIGLIHSAKNSQTVMLSITKMYSHLKHINTHIVQQPVYSASLSKPKCRYLSLLQNVVRSTVLVTVPSQLVARLNCRSILEEAYVYHSVVQLSHHGQL